MFNLLSRPGANPKTSKATGLGILTAPLHLAPARLSGFNVCPRATQGCIRACLHTAGNPAHMRNKQRARVRKTKMFFNDREKFFEELCRDIEKLARVAARRGMLPAVRLNATSDIAYEAHPVTYKGEKFPNIFAAFPNVCFYDYTKVLKRAINPNKPKNLHYTFSASETNAAECETALRHGINVAIVYHIPRSQPLPRLDRIGGTLAPVIDGDSHDYRPADPAPCIVGLRAKGRAKKDKTGFARLATVTNP